MYIFEKNYNFFLTRDLVSIVCSITIIIIFIIYCNKNNNIIILSNLVIHESRLIIPIGEHSGRLATLSFKISPPNYFYLKIWF